MMIFTALLFTSVGAYFNETMEAFVESQTKLMDYLLDGYRSDIPVIYTRDRYENHSLRTPMGVTLLYAKLLHLREPEQSASFILEVMINWNDYRLKWNPDDFDGIKMLVINRNLIWIPDILPLDALDFTDVRKWSQQYVYVNHTVHANYFMSFGLTFTCHLEIADFPFDTQTCILKFDSANFNRGEISFSADISPDILLSDVNNGEWNSLGIRANSSGFAYKTYGMNFPVAYFYFDLARNSTYYVILIVIPSFALVFLTIMGMFWSKISPCTYMDKLNLGFAVILAMVMILQITTDNIPKTSQVPILSVYILTNLLLVTFANAIVLLTGKVLVYIKRNSSSKKKESSEKGSSRDWGALFVNHIHSFFLIIFLAAASLNLAVLVSR